MSQLYNAARRDFLTQNSGFTGGPIDWINDAFVAILVNSTNYTFAATDTNLGQITNNTATRLSDSEIIPTRSATADGIAQGGSVVFTAVPVPPAGESVDAVVIYRSDNGTLPVTSEAACLLVAYIDSATGLGVVPNGGDITVVWDGGSNNIFRL